ncbi:hypothetical protein [Planosporangium mesophilum]|uniref:hypothetical protein n=1 Tax=Planosporangium mesophilum TaxID=689768 RepID=UPI00143A070C|nr:hypothetical protein [Planosporangium mesophilum]NJC84240.1 hypothetical protein [Planosporangium mesophilum]
MLSLGAFALAGCGPDSSKAGGNADGKADTLALMRSDAKGSIQKAADNSGKATSVALTMSGTADGEPLKGRGVVALGGPLKAELVIEDATDGPGTIRMLGTTFYVQIPAKDRADMDGKSWMKLDLAAASGQQAAGEVARQLDHMNPAKQVQMLVDSGSVTAVGEETVNGAKTIHYAGTMPVSTYLGQLDPSIRSQVEKTLNEKSVKEAKVDLWVDEQYNLRRSRSVLGTTTDLTVDYTDYNKPVTVEAPPAAETFDFAEMMNKLKSGITG